MSKSLLFVDANVIDYQTLLAGLASDVEVHILNATEDGVLQIANVLQNRTDLDAIHLFSHGSSGVLLLGSSVLTNDNLHSYTAELTQIGASLSATGDILLYGCEVAKGDAGQQFIKQLAQYTGADLAASTDLTGAVNQGGNWLLEANAGTIEATTLVQNNYQNVLVSAVAPTLVTNAGATAFTEAKNSPSTAVAIDNLLTVADVDTATLATATVTISLGYLANQDVLLFQNNQTGTMGNIVANYSTLTGTLSLQSAGNTATLAQWQSALRSVQYLNTSDTPNTTNRTLSFVVNDGGLNSAVATKTITVTATNDSPTFSLGTGIVTTDFGANDYGKSMTIQTDGKIIVAGETETATDSTIYQFGLTRYNADGLLDSSFGTAGKVTTSVALLNHHVHSVTLQADGKIIIAGDAQTDINSYNFALARYNTNGTLDTAFGTGGKVITPVDLYGNASVENIIIQTDGKIITAGESWNGSNYDFALTRYTSAGVLDTTFGSAGKVITQIGTSNDYGTSAILQADGKIIVAGISDDINLGSQFSLARYTSAGILDASFGTAGIVITQFDSASSIFSSTLQADGKILVSGASDNGLGWHFILARYNSNGSVDTGFGIANTGKISTLIDLDDNGYSVTLQADGKIIVAGNSLRSTSGHYDFVLTRYISSGILDSSFGNGTGIVTTAVGNNNSSSYSVTVQTDGKIVVAGNSNNDFAVVRYNTNGSLDTSFNPQNTLGGTVSFIENGTAVVLDNNVIISDVELNTSNYNAATLTLARTGAANIDDVFSNTGTLALLSPNGSLVVDGTTIGTVTSNSQGTLVLTFNANATQTLVNHTLQQITYSNHSNTPPASVQIDWIFNDDNSGGQGKGGLLSTLGNTTVNITTINHAPTLTTPATLNYTDTAFIDSFATKTGVLVGSDIDVGATLSYGITGGVDNLNGTVSKSTAYGTLTITTATGAYSFVPLASAIEPLGANVTDSTLTITVSDGTLTANKLFTVAIAQSGTTETIGNDVLMGGVGANSWAGLAGDDTYYVDVAGDSITEAVNAGADRVYSTSADYTLADNIETLVIWGAGVNGSGNGGINYLFGNALNNTLDGKGGADGMVGGAGNDTYFVDNIGDTVTENSDQGFDTVNSSVNYTLTANVEVLNLTGAVGTEALNGNGNNDNNYLFGNAGNNVLDGKAGADVMVGKAGDDTYYVDNANDVIIENANDGTDSVISSVSYGLSALNPANPTLVAGANAENLTLTGTALYAFGNDLNNTLTGNSNDNVIGGGAGLDTLIGGAGNDIYYVDVAGDGVVEKAGEGVDIVYSTATDYTLADNSEVLVVWGAGLNGTGNAQDNYVFGNPYGGGAVNNTLNGGAGNDILMGFDGADTYNGGTGQDTYNLTEQVAATDSIQIAAGDSLATVGLFDKAIGFTLGTSISSNAGVDKLDLVNTAITANTASQNGTDVGAIQTNSITNGILSFQGAGGLTIAANALNLSDALTYLQANITDGSTVAFTAASDTYVFQDGGLGVNDTVVDLVGVMANSMNNTGFGAGAVWLV